MANHAENERRLMVEFEGTRSQFEQMRELFESGELEEILGVPISDFGILPRTTVPQPNWLTRLSQWLEPSLQLADWQVCSALFGVGTSLAPAYRGSTVPDWQVQWQTALELGQQDSQAAQAGFARSRVLELGIETYEWLIALRSRPHQPEQRDLLVQVRGTAANLPAGLKLTVLDDQGNQLREAIAQEQDPYLQLDLYGAPGEQFTLTLEYGGEAQSEHFLI